MEALCNCGKLFSVKVLLPIDLSAQFNSTLIAKVFLSFYALGTTINNNKTRCIKTSGFHPSSFV